MSARAGSIRRTCACGVEFRISPSAAEHGRGTSCSRECALKLQKKFKAGAIQPHKFGRKSKLPALAPRRDAEALIEGGSHVACHRCLRLRERGVRCICERVTDVA